MKKLIIGTICIALISLSGTAFAIDDEKVLAIEDKALSANAKADGNNSRIQGLEADVADLQSQLDAFDVTELIVELCNLYALTGSPPPLLCRNCGNGYLEHLEECDDENVIDGDGCSSNCLIEECGNGRQEPLEECDDGNVTDGDGCNSFCEIEYKTVFVTSHNFYGDIGDTGGIANADNFCDYFAHEAGHTGTYKAWLSDSSSSVLERFNHSNTPYILVDGTIIANNWDDLTDGTLAAPINLDEFGNSILSRVWTNTVYTGETKTDDPSRNCDDFQSTYQYYNALTGVTLEQDIRWTDNAYFVGCDYAIKLYCFEQ